MPKFVAWLSLKKSNPGKSENVNQENSDKTYWRGCIGEILVGLNLITTIN